VTESRFPYEEGNSDLSKCRTALPEYLSSVRTEVKYDNETEMNCEVLKNHLHLTRDHGDLEWIDKYAHFKFCLIEASLAAKLVKRDAGGNRYFTMAFIEGHSHLFSEFGTFNSFAMRKKVSNKESMRFLKGDYSTHHLRQSLFVKTNATLADP
jgi:hypothetical protein